MKKKILITGSEGFLGSHVKNVFKIKNEYEVISSSRKEFNLLNPIEFDNLLNLHKPNVLIHLAAYSGGIGANKSYPADFFFQNSILTSYAFELSKKYDVEKIIYPMGGCSYPSNASSPIKEEQMWSGYPQKESAGYSMAKKMSIVASESYFDQYGLNSCILIPGNMYGEFDNFKNNESHVIPALIRKFYEAKKNNLKSVTLWGDGSPVRDFVYAKDVAEIMVNFIQLEEKGPINISSGTGITIKNLSELISNLIGYDGKIIWDSSKPNGQKIKIFDTTLLKKYNLLPKTKLNEGLEYTINWFSESINNNSYIRL